MNANRPLPDPAALPPTLGLETAGRLLGISRSTAYTLAAQDRFPVPVVRIGRSYRVPTAPLLALLGLTPQPQVRQPQRGEDPPPDAEEPS